MAAAKNEQMASFISKSVDRLRDRKNQKEIAEQAGYVNPNMITFLKNGNAKLALDRVPDLAAALDVDAKFLWNLAVLQYVNEDAQAAILPLMGPVVSENEMEVLEFIRSLTEQKDVKLDTRLRTALSKAYKGE